jgi:hypothetical protein
LLAPATAWAALPDGRAIAVETSVSPDVHLFAEPVVARVRVIVDSKEFDPDRIRVESSVAPYELVGHVEQTRRTIGEVVELQYATTLRCLTSECVAPRYRTVLGEQESGRPERFTYRFQPAEILYERPSGRAELLIQRPFPALEVVSRINTAQLEAVDPLDQSGLVDPAAASSYTASLEPPSTTYRVTPQALAGMALALAGVLLLFPAWLTGRVAVARWRALRRPQPLTPVDRALLLVEWASRIDDGDADRRRALEALADVLDQTGEAPLAETARTQAWATDAPDPARSKELAGKARTVLGGRDWSR